MKNANARQSTPPEETNVKTQCFAVYDVASRTYSHPFYLLREDMALRAFSDAINSPSHEFGKHPADYTLFVVAEFDDATGEHTSYTPGPRLIATGLSVIKPKDQGEVNV